MRNSKKTCYDFALQNCFCDFAWPKKHVLQFVLVNKNSFAILCDKHDSERLKLPQKMPVFITLGPCVGIFVAVLYMISKYFDLAYWTLTLPINWIFFASFTCITLLRVKKPTKNRLLNCSNFFARHMFGFCPTHVASLRDHFMQLRCDFGKPIMRLCATQISGGGMEFGSRKINSIAT